MGMFYKLYRWFMIKVRGCSHMEFPRDPEDMSYSEHNGDLSKTQLRQRYLKYELEEQDAASKEDLFEGENIED